MMPDVLTNLPPKSGAYRMAEKVVNGNMPIFLEVARADGRSYRDIAEALAGDGVDVSHETVRGWAIRLGIK